MLIPVLSLEEAVQVNDLTRFDATKSVKVKGAANPINAMTVAPAANVAAISVFDADEDERYLDYVYTAQQFDITSAHNKITIEVGGTEYSALVPEATYTLATLLAAVKIAVEAVVSSYVLSYSVDSLNRITLAPSLPTVLVFGDPADLLKHLNFYDAGTMVSLPVEYGLHKVTLTVSSISESASVVKYIKVFTAIGDRLFSSDEDLTAKEKDILKWVSAGRVSFLADHRSTQSEIIDWLFRNNFRGDQGRALTKWSLANTKELRLWSAYLTLANLFRDFSNSVDDVFRQKSKAYDSAATEARSMYALTLDTDNDGVADDVQEQGTGGGSLVHR